MRRITPVKSQEALKSDIFCLKRQLSLIVDENQLLKVKIRRLENDLRRKEKYIECFQSDPQKDREARRFRYDSEAIIHKLQKRNEKLEDMILERDLQNEKRYNDMKTMCLYSHANCKKTNRKGSATNFFRQNSASRNETNCNSSRKFNARNIIDSKRPNRMRSLSSLGSKNSEEIMKNRYCVVSTGDSSMSNRQTEVNSESQKIIKILESEKNADKRAIRMKNAEIFRLSAELREIKNRLNNREDNRVTKSTSTTQLKEKFFIEKEIRDRPNFIDQNKRNVSRVRGKISERRSSRKTIQFPEADRKAVRKKLPTVAEQNEEMNTPNEICKTSLDINNKNTTKREIIRPKTRIEYVFDSEVSSDGEEFCLPSNLRSFLQQAVNTISLGSSKDEIISD